MAERISFPFRIDRPSGRVASVVQGSDAEAGEAIAHLLMTRRGERPLAPGFGTRDQSQATVVDLATDVQAGVRLFGPAGVQITGQDVRVGAGGQAFVTLEFTRDDEETN